MPWATAQGKPRLNTGDGAPGEGRRPPPDATTLRTKMKHDVGCEYRPKPRATLPGSAWVLAEHGAVGAKPGREASVGKGERGAAHRAFAGTHRRHRSDVVTGSQVGDRGSHVHRDLTVHDGR